MQPELSWNSFPISNLKKGKKFADLYTYVSQTCAMITVFYKQLSKEKKKKEKRPYTSRCYSKQE